MTRRSTALPARQRRGWRHCKRQSHLMLVLRGYEDSRNSRQPHRALNQATPLRPPPDGVTDLDHFRVRRHDRAGGVVHEYRLMA
jgi:putative transposase